MNDFSKMKNRPAAARHIGPSRRNGGMPLLGVRANGRLDGLLFELSVEQRYRNDDDRTIEAVFTFPVPVRAVLLGLELELGERKLEAVAVARAQATERYEEAIDDGDAAVLLETHGNGLYTVSVGNLKPGETAVIRYRHAELLDANRGLVRLQVPTVIAPRYGNPRDAGLEGPAIPTTDLVAEYPFDLELLLAGIKDDTSFESPTHSIRTHRTDTGVIVKLAKTAALDRDFVLEVPQANLPKDVLVAKDGDGWVAIASAVLPGLAAAERRVLALTVVLDCSGSMAGDSIEAAKRAVGRVLENLDAEDRVGLLRFGSSCHWDTEGLVGATRGNLGALRNTVRGVTADLGGTEMRAALEEALGQRVPQGMQADLLMITDGQVHELDALADLVAAAGRRLFVVAVGSAPNEALARRLSETTGGACEFVASGELAEDAIVRMFRRMRAAPRKVSGVHWPAQAAWSLPFPRSVFPDETVHLVAGFGTLPVGRVQITVAGSGLRNLGADADTAIEMPVTETPLSPELQATVARVAGARRVKLLAERDETEEATRLAERLQIASAFTSFVVVAERSAEEKAKEMPATVPVGQMLPAGFGGTASVSDRVFDYNMHALRDQAPAAAPMALEALPAIKAVRSGLLKEMKASRSTDDAPFEMPAFLRNDSKAIEREESGGAVRIDRQSARALLAKLRQGSQTSTLAELAAAGVDAAVVDALRQIGADEGIAERDLVDAFLEMLVKVAEARSGEYDEVRRGWGLRRSIFSGRATGRLRHAMRRQLFDRDQH